MYTAGYKLTLICLPLRLLSTLSPFTPRLLSSAAAVDACESQVSVSERKRCGEENTFVFSATNSIENNKRQVREREREKQLSSLASSK